MLHSDILYKSCVESANVKVYQALCLYMTYDFLYKNCVKGANITCTKQFAAFQHPL